MQNQLQLKCPLCLDRFSNKKQPYILSCGHNICQSDLIKIEQQDCPICRQKNENVDQYQTKNHEIVNLIEEGQRIINEKNNIIIQQEDELLEARKQQKSQKTNQEELQEWKKQNLMQANLTKQQEIVIQCLRQQKIEYNNEVKSVLLEKDNKIESLENNLTQLQLAIQQNEDNINEIKSVLLEKDQKIYELEDQLVQFQYIHQQLYEEYDKAFSEGQKSSLAKQKMQKLLVQDTCDRLIQLGKQYSKYLNPSKLRQYFNKELIEIKSFEDNLRSKISSDNFSSTISLINGQFHKKEAQFKQTSSILKDVNQLFSVISEQLNGQLSIKQQNCLGFAEKIKCILNQKDS